MTVIEIEGLRKEYRRRGGKVRAVEDGLSDALHERLTQRFVDRRTAVLVRDISFSSLVAMSGATSCMRRSAGIPGSWCWRGPTQDASMPKWLEGRSEPSSPMSASSA